MPIFDLTASLSENTPVFPGDPLFHAQSICSLSAGCNYNLKCLSFSNHAGTHFDFPAHVIENGKTSSDFQIGAFVGKGVILEYEENSNGRVSLEFVQKNREAIFENKFVFFKAPANSAFATYVEKPAAEKLVEYEVEVVGVDSMSIDPIDAEDLPAHHALLSKDVLIIEGLNLKDIPPGKGDITAYPLNIPNMDGLPARVTMRR